MGKFATKHKDREQIFKIKSFSDGLNKEMSASFLPVTALTRCKNIKFIRSKNNANGENLVVATKRQGTEVVSNSVLPSSAEVVACTYYIKQSQYILASSSKLYYLDASNDPVEIGSISGIPTFTEFHNKLIIHDSGVTKAWDGTTFETLNCLYKDEILGTGDNVVIDFSGILSNIPVKAGSISITYTDGTLKTITDDGAGALIGDIAADTNTINYTTGAYSFRCSGAPDNATTIYGEYEHSGGAPKSKAGMLRGGRLYVWGDSDNTSRLAYTNSNDEDAWDTTSSGGYIDVDPNDGYTLTGCLNFYQSLVLLKENSVHRLDNFPGDSTFRVEPLLTDLGCISYRTASSDGEIISFLSKEGWIAMSATERFGDIQKTTQLSKHFHSEVILYSDNVSYTDFNQLDNQLWLSMNDGTDDLPYIYVINLETGGQLSLYEFAFTHSCFSFVNGEMLIGGTDGKLYKLLQTNSRFLDNGVSYTDDTFIQGTFADWGLRLNRKHNKKIYVRMYGTLGMSATLSLHKNDDYSTSFYTASIAQGVGDSYINPDLKSVYIYDMSEIIGAVSTDVIKKKFNYRNVMFNITDISGPLGAEIYGLDFAGAVIGE